MNSVTPRAYAPAKNIRALELAFHLSSAQVEHAANALNTLILLKAANKPRAEKFEAQIQMARVTLIAAKTRHNGDRRALNAAVAEGAAQ